MKSSITPKFEGSTSFLKSYTTFSYFETSMVPFQPNSLYNAKRDSLPNLFLCLPHPLVLLARQSLLYIGWNHSNLGVQWYFSMVLQSSDNRGQFVLYVILELTTSSDIFLNKVTTSSGMPSVWTTNITNTSHAWVDFCLQWFVYLWNENIIFAMMSRGGELMLLTLRDLLCGGFFALV